MSEKPVVVITGAGGFIGGRMVEAFLDSGRWTVRAVVRRWSTAARIGRFDVDIGRADVTDAAAMGEILKGASAAVHCARGAPDVNVRGTRALLEAALAAGVKRVVHLSTVAVYGDAEGEITEAHVLEPGASPYGSSKLEAEGVCAEFGERGLEIVILRPTIVYGPFSDLWTIEFAERLRGGPWMLPEEVSSGWCNLVYVDDVVRAAMIALKRAGVAGQAFNINGPERVTWWQYFQALNDAMGLPPLVARPLAASRASALLMQPVRQVAKAALKRFQKPIMALYQRSDAMKRIMKGAESVIRKTPSTGEFKMYSKRVWYDGRRAAEQLGYEAATDMRRGVALSAQWLRHHGFC